MKRLFAVLLMMTLVLSLNPAVMAAPDDGILRENGGYEENFYRDQPVVWSFTPSQTGEYYLSVPSNGSLIGQIVGQTMVDEYDLQTGQHIQIYNLTGGKTYQVKIEMNPNEPGNMVKEVFNIARKEPMERLVLSTTTLTMQRDQYESLYVEIEPAYYPLTGLKWTSSDSSILEIDSTEGNTCGFWARKVGTAKITASLGGKTATCTVTVEKATGEWDNYEVWPASQTKKKLTMTNGQPFSYTPTKTGTYAMHTEGDLHVMMRGTSPSHMLNNKTIDTLKGIYELVDLIAGETYVLEVNANSMDGSPCTGMVYLEQARDVSDLILYGANLSDVVSINGYVGGMKELYATTDPIYAYGLHGGYQYVSSNSAIADPNDEEGASQHIMLYREGTCKITVTCGPVSKSLVATVKPSPVLTAGTATTIRFAPTDAYGVTCLFTPTVSGKYTFSMRGTGGTCNVEGTNIGTYFEGAGSMSGTLQAGKTYKIELFVGESDHTISVSGGGAVAPTLPTVPTQPTQPDDPNQPSNPTRPSDPDQPSNPTQPTAPTQTTAPADDEIQQLAGQMGGSYQSGVIVVETEEKEIALSAEHLDQLAQKNLMLAVVGGGYRVDFDSNALKAMANRGDATLTLTVSTGKGEDFTKEQTDAIKDKTLVMSVTASLGEYTDFAGGKATVIVPQEDGNYGVYYLSDSGELEKVPSHWADGCLHFTTGHFSDYVVLEEEEASVSDVGGADKPEDTSVILKILPWVLIGAAVIAGAVIAVVVLKKKKKA